MRRIGPWRLNLVEALVAFALLAIISSLSRSSRPHPKRHVRTETTAPSRASNEGAYNTIETPESRRQRSPEALPMNERATRGLVRVAITLAIFVLIPMYLRHRHLRRRSPRRPPEHEHPPDAEE